MVLCVYSCMMCANGDTCDSYLCTGSGGVKADSCSSEETVNWLEQHDLSD